MEKAILLAVDTMGKGKCRRAWGTNWSSEYLMMMGTFGYLILTGP